MLRFISIAIFLLSALIPAPAAPRLQLLPDGIVDLGEFEEREVQTREVFIRNVGDAPLEILKVFSTCSCTRVKYDSEPVAPGDSARLTVIFDGRRRKPGPVRKVFRLTTNGDPAVNSILVKGDIIRPFQK